MNDVLFDKEYLYLRNELLFYLICISYCQTKGAASLLFLVMLYTKKEKKKKLGASESVKKTALQTYSSKIIIIQKFITREDKL